MDKEDKKLIGKFVLGFLWDTAKSVGNTVSEESTRKYTIYTQNEKKKKRQIMISILLIIAIVVVSVLRLKGVYNGLI